MNNLTPRGAPFGSARFGCTAGAACLDVPIPTDVVIANAQRKTRQLVRAGRIQPSEQDDFAADLVAHAVKKWPRYNPKRATPAGFVLMLMLSHSSTLLRKRKRLFRLPRTPGESVVGDDTDGSHPTRRVGWDAGRDDDGVRRLDDLNEIQAVLAKVPPELRRAAEALASTDSVDEAAKRLGVHRATVYRQRERLRAIFKKSRA